MVAKESAERNASSRNTSSTVTMNQSRTENALIQYIESSIERFR